MRIAGFGALQQEPVLGSTCIKRSGQELTWCAVRAQLRAGPGGEAARALLEAPQRTLRTCRRTLENCSENLQTLGQLLQQSVAASQFQAAGGGRGVGAATAGRLPPPGAGRPQAPPGSHNTTFVACRENVVSPGFPSLQVCVLSAQGEHFGSVVPVVARGFRSFRITFREYLGIALVLTKCTSDNVWP